MPDKNPWTYSLSAALLLMAPFDILASLAMDIYLPVVPAMPGILQTNPATIQLTLSLYMIVLGLGQVVFGPIADRTGRRPVLMGGAMLFILASVGLAGSSAAGPFLLFRILQAAGASAMLVATFATVRDVYADRPEGATIYGLFGAILAFVPAIGPIAGALISEHCGWRAIFWTLAGLGLVPALHAQFRWHETRPIVADARRRSVLPIFRSFDFWTYTLGFSAAMGSFFVFFSTASRVMVGKAGYSSLQFSVAFATVAIAMILATRFARHHVLAWGTVKSLKRGMAMLILGAGLLGIGEVLGTPSLLTFIAPMWVIAIGIVFTASVTANGALREFGDVAGSAVALYFCTQSLIVGSIGTLATVILPGDTAWPLAAYASGMAACVLIASMALSSGQSPQS